MSCSFIHFPVVLWLFDVSFTAIVMKITYSWMHVIMEQKINKNWSEKYFLSHISICSFQQKENKNSFQFFLPHLSLPPLSSLTKLTMKFYHSIWYACDTHTLSIFVQSLSALFLSMHFFIFLPFVFFLIEKISHPIQYKPQLSNALYRDIN